MLLILFISNLSEALFQHLSTFSLTFHHSMFISDFPIPITNLTFLFYERFSLDIFSSYTFNFLLSCTICFLWEFSKLFSSLPFLNFNLLVIFTLAFSPTVIIYCLKVSLYAERWTSETVKRVCLDWPLWTLSSWIVFYAIISVLLFLYFSVSFHGFLPNPNSISISSHGSFLWQLHLLYNSSKYS